MVDIHKLMFPDPILKSKKKIKFDAGPKVPEIPITDGLTNAERKALLKLKVNQKTGMVKQNIFQIIWTDKLNIIRHFSIGVGIISVFLLALKYGAGINSAIGASATSAAIRKVIEDEIRRRWGKDLLGLVVSVLQKRNPFLKGSTMSKIRIEAEQFGDALAAVIIRATDDVPNSTEIGALLGDAMKAFTEGSDFANIPQADRLDAALLGMATAMKKVADAKIKFSDETIAG